MKQMTVAQKILLPYFVLLTLVIGVLSYVFIRGWEEQRSLQHATEKLKRQNSVLTELNNLRRERQRAVLSYRFDRDPAYITYLRKTDSMVSSMVLELQRSTKTRRERALVTNIREARDSYLIFRDSYLRTIQINDQSRINLSYTRFINHVERLDALFSDLTVLTVKSLDRNIAQIDRVRKESLLVVLGFGFLGITMIVVFGYATRRHLVLPLVEMTKTANAISKGDLNQRLAETHRPDEVGTLARAFNDMSRSLATAKTTLEEKLSELKRSNRDLQQFAYVCSHDLKEPLRMVGLYTQLLKKQSELRLDAESRESLTYIVEGAARMQSLIDDLLLYSRISEGDESFEIVDINRIVGLVKEDLRVAISESGTEIYTEPLPELWGQPTLLVQLFENLLSNAIKFKGELSPSIHISCRKDDGQWIFSVSDNGIGFNPEFSDKIFVIFQRLHARSTYPGTGIGLAICKKIVERHGGKIWVDSTPGRGSTFSFSIPHRSGSDRLAV